jgi:hypothetical protein
MGGTRNKTENNETSPEKLLSKRRDPKRGSVDINKNLVEFRERER